MLRAAKSLGRRLIQYTRELAGRRRFIASIRDSDVFLVTYPKSGTTWVAFFLASIIADRTRGGRRDLTLDGMQGWVPGVNPHYLREPLPEVKGGQTPRIFKAHSPANPWFRHVVYLVRDPRDVMVSYFYHFRRRKDDFDLSMEEFVERNDHYAGDWGEHVRGWLKRTSDEHVLLLRYEDLHLEPVTSFRRIAEACGIDLTDEELQHYVERSSFGRMRKAEEVASTENVRGIDFIRQGVVGDWRSELSEGSVRMIEQRYGDLMKILGYEPCFAPHSAGLEADAAVPERTHELTDSSGDAGGPRGSVTPGASTGARQT